MDARELAARDRQVARLLGAAGQQHRVELGLQALGADGFLGPVGDLGALRPLADDDVGAELDAFGLELLDATVDVALVELEVGNAVAQQAADLVVLLEHGHLMADARQLLGRGQTGRAGADDGDLLAGLDLGRLRLDPAFGPCPVDDRVLDRLDADRVAVDVGHAGGLARRRADAAGELGEVVGAVQHRDRVLPVLVIDQVVEVRNDVVDRAAVVAERRAAVHAARALDLRLLGRQTDDEFLVALQALLDRLVTFFDALVLEETSDLTHDAFNLEEEVITWPGPSGPCRRPSRRPWRARWWRRQPWRH